MDVPGTTNKEEDNYPPATITPDKGTPTDRLQQADSSNVPLEVDNTETDNCTDRVIDDFTKDLDNYKRQEELALTAMMSLGRTTAEMPTIKPGKWKYTGKLPNPISIRKARRLLAAAYAKVPCSLKEAGLHGYAWIVEEPEQWNKRKDTSTVAPPEKPVEDYTDLQGRLEHADKMEKYLLYHHLTQAGTDKLVTWFGKAMFLDLCTDGELDADITPKDLLTHLEETYSTNADELEYFEDVTKAFNAPYDSKRPVEEYFMRLQEAQADAEDLGVGFTDTQVITQALRQFIKQHGKEGRKAANKWSDEDDKSWKDFKLFWKKKIHAMGRASYKEANAVDLLTNEMSSIRADMIALQVENRDVKDRNEELLSQQSRMEYAFQTEAARQRTGAHDDTSTISTITEAMSQMEHRMNRKMAALNVQSSGGSDTTLTSDTTSTDRANRIKVARNRNPAAYKHLNGGRGKQFMFYCANADCGVNCTHNTDRCYELTTAQKEKYKDATYLNRMGGSEKHLDRFGRFQRDYNFDSL